MLQKLLRFHGVPYPVSCFSAFVIHTGLIFNATHDKIAIT